MLLGPVVERVPLQVVRVAAIRVPLGERCVDGGDVGPPCRQDRGAFVRSSSYKNRHVIYVRHSCGPRKYGGPRWSRAPVSIGADRRPSAEPSGERVDPCGERVEAGMFEGEKVLITGASGKIAFPIARGWRSTTRSGGARLSDPAAAGQARERRRSARSRRRLEGDFPRSPRTSTTSSTPQWIRASESGAVVSRPTHRTRGDLMVPLRNAQGFVYSSTGSIYAYQGQRPLNESDGPGRRCEPTTVSRRSPGE